MIRKTGTIVKSVQLKRKFLHLAKANKSDLVLNRHSSVLADMFRQNSLIFAFFE